MTAAVLPLAWRNLLRHRRRSLLTITAIAIGLAALLFLWGVNDGVYNAMIRNFQATFIGSLQIHRQGFSSRPTLDHHFRDTAAIRTALERARISHWTSRLQSFAIAAGQQTSMGTLLVGVDPQHEQVVSRLAMKVSRGRLLTAEDTHACILGAISARILGVDVGDAVTLLAQGFDGSLAAEQFILIGILDTGAVEIDRGMALAPLATVQDMLGMPGQLTHVVMVVPEARLTQVAVELRDALSGEGLEVQQWDEMFPLLREWVTLSNSFYYIFLSVVLVIIVAGVLNTVLVSMLERQREFGILMALGSRSRDIGAVVAIEACLLGAAGAALGSLLGLGVVAFYGRIGIDMSFMGTLLARVYLDTMVYPAINTDHLRFTVLAICATTVVAALYPAWRAMRLQPVEAIAHA